MNILESFAQGAACTGFSFFSLEVCFVKCAGSQQVESLGCATPNTILKLRLPPVQDSIP